MKLFLFLSLSLICFTSCFSTKTTKKEINETYYEVNQDSVLIETSKRKIFKPYISIYWNQRDKTPRVLCLQEVVMLGLQTIFMKLKFFAKNGIVALVCDKSGAGSSKTKKSWREQSFKDKTNEYFELFEWLLNHDWSR